MSYPAKNLNELISHTLYGKRVEPVQRLVGGQFGWAFHRFPIKGGISGADVLAKNIIKNNALLSRLMGKK